MLILTNCLIKNADEGCVNVAYNLIKRIKTAVSDVKVISYERTSELTDEQMELNKLMLSIPLFKLLRKEKKVLYIPFPAKMIATAIRIWILSLFCKDLKVLISMHDSIDKLSGFLLKNSKAKIFVLSESAYKDFEPYVGKKVVHIKTGVDTERFIPVSTEKTKELKTKYAVEFENSDDVRAVITKIATSRGCIKAGGVLDLDRVIQTVLRDFRSGRLGRFTLDEP